MTEKILSHALEIISLLTGEVSRLRHLAKSLLMTEMNNEKKMDKRILNHAMEIICVVTGEEYTIVKNCPHSNIQQRNGEAGTNYSRKQQYGPICVFQCVEDGLKHMVGENHQIPRPLGTQENRISGLDDEHIYSGSINEDGEYESEEKNTRCVQLHVSQWSGLKDENVASVNEEGENAMEEKEFLQVTIHSELSAGDSNVKASIFSMLEQEGKPGVWGHRQIKEEEIPITISEANGSVDMNTAEKVHFKMRRDAVAEINQQTIALNNSPREFYKNLFAEFVCSECGKRFSQKTDFEKHKRIHKNQKPFSCSECGKSFSRNAHLTVHMRIHTGDKPFACSGCDKCFTDSSKLARHQRSHTGERPFLCFECNKGFYQKSNLINHQRIHTGEKPFACSVCAKCFCQRSHLISHEKIHVDEMPFSCSACGKCFRHKSNLLKHLRVHTS